MPDFRKSGFEMNEEQELKLEPFIHQVGGHSPLFCLDPVTVCKPLEQREYNFYSTLPSSLVPFTPSFKGSMKVEISEDDEGYITLKGQPPVSYRMRYLRSPPHTKPKLRLKRCRSIEIETGAPSDQYFEDELVKEEKTYNPWALKCHRDNLKKIGINLVKSVEPGLADPTFQEFILLENLTFKYKYPCVLDLKVGTRQYGDAASATKKQSKNAKVAGTTSGTLGYRLGGMQVYQANLDRFICRSKNYGKSLSVEGLKISLRQFFSNGLVMRMDVIHALVRKLKELRDILEKLESYRFYTSSLLVIYDGSVNQHGQNSRCYEEMDSRTRNSLSTTSLLQLPGRYINGANQSAGNRSKSDNNLDYCSQLSMEPSQEHRGSGRRSASCETFPSSRGSSEARLWPFMSTSDVNNLVNVKIIDFAHSTHRGLKDLTLHEGPDRGFLLGLENFMKTLEELQGKTVFPVTI